MRSGITKQFTIELEKRILVLDGAMGTNIQNLHLSDSDYQGDRFKDHNRSLKGNNDILSLTKPGIIKNIHKNYLEAGADIITTNSFGATSIVQSEYGTENYIYELNLKSAQIARHALDEFQTSKNGSPRFIAGSLGPTNKTLSMNQVVDSSGSDRINFDHIKNDYKIAAQGLIDGGTDILLLETVFDSLNAKAALAAISEIITEQSITTPVWISVSLIHPGGRTLIGQTVEAFFYAIRHIKPICVGLNCGFGPENYRTYLQELSNIADTAVSVHPNAGLPDENGCYKTSPEKFSSYLADFVSDGLVNIVGGCCGTTVKHIASLAKAVADSKPRIYPKFEPACRLSGLEPLTIKPDSLFVNIGERTNIAGSSKFKKLIQERRYEDALEVARQQVNNGAQIIDVGMDEPLLDSKREMAEFLNAIIIESNVSKVPIMIDSSDWDVIETGLKYLPGKGIVNSISLKDGEKQFKKQAEVIKKYGAAVVVMAFDEKGQAVTCERKVEICKRSYCILVDELDFPPEDIILDPNILTVATGITEHNDYAVNFINACRIIKKELPYALISGGISNLSFSLRGNNNIRKIMHSVFLYHAIKAGMDMGIMNSGQIAFYEDIPLEQKDVVEDVIFNRNPDAVDKLLEIATEIKSAKNKAITKDSWRNLPIGERVNHAIINGISENLENDLAELIAIENNNLAVIDKHIMTAMNQVGDYFGDGKMFLPQVIKSAGVVKRAIDFLKPYLDDDQKQCSQSLGKVVLATVKGDVHDIGKNILRMILECNNFEVIDLGVMVPTDDLIDRAVEAKADIIGLSGLISPSLDEMAKIANELERRQLKIPLLIGGAASSKLHTALKIQSVYSGPVIYVANASHSINIIRQLLSKDTKDRFIEELHDEYISLIEDQNNKEKTTSLVTLEYARKNRPDISWHNYQPQKPKCAGIKVFNNYPITKLKSNLKLTSLYRTYELYSKDGSTHHVDHRNRLIKDAEELLDRIIAEDKLSVQAVIGFFGANSSMDNIEIYPNPKDKDRVITVPFLRQQQRNDSDSGFYSLADFIAPKSDGVDDYIGAFALTAGIGAERQYEILTAQNDEYSAILLKLIANRLAEAMAEQLHDAVAKDHWGYDQEKDEKNKSTRGIRPAPGYATCPDHSAKTIIFRLLDVETNIKLRLSENYSMIPAASVCGWYFSHPRAKYFSIGQIGQDQIDDYGIRKSLVEDGAVDRSRRPLV